MTRRHLTFRRFLLLTGLLLAAPAAVPAQTGEGTLVGIVTDAATGDAIIEAGVEVLGLGKKTRTDLDGRYRIAVPPGTWDVRFFAPLYQGSRLTGLAVRAAAETKASAALRPEGDAAVEVVEVVAQADRATEGAQLLLRQQSNVVSDNVSAQAIKESPDGDAGEIVVRLPAVTVKDDRYINVRGLNERYTTALLNENRLPSTDPERRVVPLDLFPADFLESISLVKSYSPEQPGDFAGGLARIELRDLPEKFTLSMGLSGGANFNALQHDSPTYRGAGLADAFALGNHFRRLPGTIPGDANGVNATLARQQAYGRSFRNIWEPGSHRTPPNLGASFSIGQRFGPVGVSAGLTYSNEYRLIRRGLERQYQNQGSAEEPEIRLADELNYTRSNHETRIGALLNAGWELHPDHRLTLRTLYNRNANDEVIEGSGDEDSQALVVGVTRLKYTTDELAFGRFGGSHRFGILGVDWRTALARTVQDQPDGRFVARNDPFGDNVFSNDNFGGRRIYADLSESMTDNGIDFSLPFRAPSPGPAWWSELAGTFRFGPAFMYRERDQSLRQFRYDVRRSGFDLSLPTEVLLAPGNLGPLPSGPGVRFEEVSQPRDSFRASQEIAGAYGLVELPLLNGWRSERGLEHTLRLSGGVRQEYSYIRVSTTDERGLPRRVNRNDLDTIPALNLVYGPREDMNVRFSFSQTVTRPDFRELSPVQYPAPGALRTKAGNPDLVSSGIGSLDLRWEWFFSPRGEILSVSAFRKDIDRPIEQIVTTEGSNALDTFANALRAEVYGLELESRFSLGRLWDPLRTVGLTQNVTLADSTVRVPQAGPGAVTTSARRPLQGQAPFVLNAALDWDPNERHTLRLLYNTIGRRIESAGAFGLPDNYEERRDQLDFVWILRTRSLGTPQPLTVKLAVENLLNDDYVFTQGPALQRRYFTGVRSSVGVSYAF